MTRILITGGCGFIGSNFIHHALHGLGGAPASCCPDHARYGAAPEADRDLRIHNLDALTYAGDPANLEGVADRPGYRFHRGDVADATAVEAALKASEPDAIVHFAAESHVDRSISDGAPFARTNALGTQVLLDAARRHDIEAFLHVSTDEVYGSIEKGSFAEDAPFRPSSPYAASKAGADLLALAHHRTYGLPVAVARCTNNYGPRQHAEKLLPKLIGQARRNQPLTLYGTGRNVRDWLYVKDHCAALLHILGLRRWGEAWNVAGRDEKTNLDVARHVLRELGRPETLIAYVQDRPGHDWRYSLDDRRLRATGWAPRVGFREGFAATWAWAQQAGGR